MYDKLCYRKKYIWKQNLELNFLKKFLLYLIYHIFNSNNNKINPFFLKL